MHLFFVIQKVRTPKKRRTPNYFESVQANDNNFRSLFCKHGGHWTHSRPMPMHMKYSYICIHIQSQTIQQVYQPKKKSKCTNNKLNSQRKTAQTQIYSYICLLYIHAIYIIQTERKKMKQNKKEMEEKNERRKKRNKFDVVVVAVAETFLKLFKAKIEFLLLLLCFSVFHYIVGIPFLVQTLARYFFPMCFLFCAQAVCVCASVFFFRSFGYFSV